MNWILRQTTNSQLAKSVSTVRLAARLEKSIRRVVFGIALLGVSIR